MTETIRIAGDGLSASVSTLGAELQTIEDEDGRSLLYDGDPRYWTGRAPILFPIVGALRDDSLRVDGASYTMGKHGFARRSQFTPVEQGDDHVVLRLEDSEATRAHYPFAFRLDLRFAIAGATLTLSATITNRGEAELPASFGYHPALRWPLPYGGDKTEHRLLFEAEETQPIREIDKSGLIAAATRPSPVEGNVLPLRDSLFTDDALVFDPVHSRHVRYGVPGKRQIEVRWPDMPLLGVWTKPGAPFLCIEPWHGIADPAGFDGAFRDKPWMMRLAPDEARRFDMHISVLDAEAAAD